jgi:hypothetical protein
VRSTSLGGGGGGDDDDELVPGDERSQHEVLQRVRVRLCLDRGGRSSDGESRRGGRGMASWWRLVRQ